MKTVKYLELKKNQTNFPKTKINSSELAADFIRGFYSDDIGIFESFFILLLDRANNTTGYAKISQGGVAGTVVDTKIIAKYAVDFLSSGVILAHNHPSGQLVPSNEDLTITRKIKQGLELLDVKVLDHIILTEEGYYSFSDEGTL
jgi:DNA repair protein RadC